MAEKHIDELVNAIVAKVTLAKADGKITLREGGAIVGEIVEAALHIASALKDRQGHFEPLVTACEKIFDDYVQPIDLPINNLLEKAADRILRGQIRPLLAALYDFTED